MTSNSDLRVTYKISLNSVTVKGAKRQKVKLTANLFSHTVSQAINRCGRMGHFSAQDNWVICAFFFKQVKITLSCRIIIIKLS
jgi:hypothetical protein